jgi:hypothetical protein
MSTETRRTENGTEKRTVRACEQSMTVVPHGDGTGMFNIYSGESPEPYVVDLAGEHDRCTCPDVQHNLEVGERCKHSRRVRLEFGLAPFEDVPQVREEHAALTDVELARRQRGIDIKPEPEPEPITVSDAKPARAVATDGGVVVSEPETRVRTPRTSVQICPLTRRSTSTASLPRRPQPSTICRTSTSTVRPSRSQPSTFAASPRGRAASEPARIGQVGLLIQDCSYERRRDRRVRRYPKNSRINPHQRNHISPSLRILCSSPSTSRSKGLENMIPSLGFGLSVSPSV